MKTSDSINEVAAAFAQAQGEMQNPGFDSKNPHFGNQFASLAAVRNAAVPPLAAHGIAIVQELANVEGGISCVTRVIHSSGQWLEFGPLIMPFAKADAQGFGSAGTYCKRYALMAIVVIAGDLDDDANDATGKPGAPMNQGHHPRGDLGKSVPLDKARETATAMRGILELDVDERVKTLKVLDRHDLLNKDADLYVAASDQLSAKERSAWKTYVSLAKAAEKADRQIAGGGRTF